MRTRLTTVVAALAAVGGALLVPVVAAPAATAAPAAPAAPGCPSCGGVSPSNEGLLGRVRAQLDEVNRYSGGSRVPCHGRDVGNETDNTGVEFDGWLRFREPELGEDTWRELLQANGGLLYRLECWTDNPDIGAFGEFRDIVHFPDLTGENIARLLIDQFFQGLERPQPVLNPAGTTLVNAETWLSVDLAQTEVASPVISVPGISIQAFAEATEVNWYMGDNSPVFSCPLTAAPADCPHSYDQSSAGQGDDRFHGAASIIWEGTYAVNGTVVNAADPFLIPLESTFDIAVAENNAVVTDGG